MSNDATYTSADNVLRLLRYLQHTDAARVSDAADELGVARSTAHRLLGSLCGNGFAKQNSDRTYTYTGPVDGPAGVSTAQLAELVRPHIEWLVEETDETAHLMTLEGQMVRVIDSVEASQPLRIGSRMGVLLPSHIAATGRLLLAAIPEDTFTAIYTDGPPEDSGYADIEVFRRAMRVQRDYLPIFGEAERGVHAVAMLVKSPSGHPLGAISLSGPSMRLTRARMPWAVAHVQQTVQRIHASLVVHLMGR
ncbi:IclR family transcriptional regulator [Rhodococcus opacus]|nr:IclR family transcriptional regulator [Rhodococcus opacus]